MVHDDGIAGVDGEQGCRVAIENTVGVGILPKIKHDLPISQEDSIRVKFPASQNPSVCVKMPNGSEPRYSELRMRL